jgi:pilus assembly protein Flp/PilA
MHFAPACSSAAKLLLGRFLADTSGATAIEYAMVAAGVGAAVASAVWSLGTSVKTTFYDKLSNVF